MGEMENKFWQRSFFHPVQCQRFKVSAVNTCTSCCHSDLFLKQEKHVLFHQTSLPSLTLCLGQPSRPVQNCHGLIILTGCLNACLIPTTDKNAFLRYCSIPLRWKVGGGGHIPCICAQLWPELPEPGQYSS
jgi:hypothetical protein